MKRAHDDISVPADADVPNGASAAVAAENRTGKAGNSTVAPETTAGGGAAGHSRKKCPYLDTINRNVLDFDFEKVRHQCDTVLWYCTLLLVSSLCWVCVSRSVCAWLYLLVSVGALKRG